MINNLIKIVCTIRDSRGNNMRVTFTYSKDSLKMSTLWDSVCLNRKKYRCYAYLENSERVSVRNDQHLYLLTYLATTDGADKIELFFEPKAVKSGSTGNAKVHPKVHSKRIYSTMSPSDMYKSNKRRNSVVTIDTTTVLERICVNEMGSSHDNSQLTEESDEESSSSSTTSSDTPDSSDLSSSESWDSSSTDLSSSESSESLESMESFPNSRDCECQNRYSEGNNCRSTYFTYNGNCATIQTIQKYVNKLSFYGIEHQNWRTRPDVRYKLLSDIITMYTSFNGKPEYSTQTSEAICQLIRNDLPWYANNQSAAANLLYKAYDSNVIEVVPIDELFQDIKFTSEYGEKIATFAMESNNCEFLEFALKFFTVRIYHLMESVDVCSDDITFILASEYDWDEFFDKLDIVPEDMLILWKFIPDEWNYSKYQKAAHLSKEGNVHSSCLLKHSYNSMTYTEFKDQDYDVQQIYFDALKKDMTDHE